MDIECLWGPCPVRGELDAAPFNMSRNAISRTDDDGEPGSCEEALICGKKIAYLAGGF